MLYDFFYLYFKCPVDEDAHGNIITESFAIGYFSTKAKAKQQIAVHKNLKGFCDYPLDCFKIRKYRVKFKKIVEDKSQADLFVASHQYDDEDDFVNWIIFGAYETEKEAKLEIEKNRNKKPYCGYPDDFIIAQWKVDRDIYWETGFFTYE